MQSARFALTALIALSAPAMALPPKGSVLLNEVVIDSRGSSRSDQEFIEIYAPPGTPLGGLSVITVVAVPVAEQNFAPGTTVRRFDLPPEARTNQRGFYLLANKFTEAGYGVKADLLFDEESRLTNEPQTIALIPTQRAPEKGQLASDTVGDEDVYDAVALRDATNENESIFYFGAPMIGPDQTYLAAGAARVRDGVDTNDISDWILADIDNPPDTYNTPGAPNKQGGEAVVADASNVTPAPSTPAPTPGARPAANASATHQWRYYSPVGLEEAVDQEGTALVYVRSAKFEGCRRFEQTYLLHKDARPLLAGRPTFYLDVSQPGHGRYASMLGVYRVPTLVFRRKGQEPRYLAITDSTPPQEIVAFLKLR